VNAPENSGYTNICARTYQELDLTHKKKCHRLFETEKPDCVTLAAARVDCIGPITNILQRGGYEVELLKLPPLAKWD